MCRAHDHRSPLSAAIHTASLWHRMPVRDMKTIFKNLCYNTDYVCFAKTVSPAPVFVRILGSHHPGTRLRLVPGFRDPGSVLILGEVTQYGNPYLICILWETYFLLTITPFRLTGHAISENNAQIYQQNLYFRRNWWSFYSNCMLDYPFVLNYTSLSSFCKF